MISTRYEQMLADALAWLRYERRCYVLATERGPWEDCPHRPDVIGVGPGRRCIEIEIKRTLSDFNHDAAKAIWTFRDKFNKGVPSQFYYFTPPPLADRVLPLLKPGLGLLTWREAPGWSSLTREIFVVKPAKKNPTARKLTIHQTLNMVRHQSGSLVTVANKLSMRELELDALKSKTVATTEPPVSETATN